MSRMQTMFNPKTIALIGATEKEGTVGRTILENLLRSKERRIFPVNPHTNKMLGVESYPGIAAVSEHVDLAVVATPARSVPQAVEECGQAGVEGVVIISAGFKEIGKEGTQLESEIDQIRKKYGMRIMGPNCLGFVRPPLDLNATFLSGKPPAGNIAFISQSGALGSAILDWAVSAGIGFSMFASLGSMIDIDFGDTIDFLGDDEATRSILIYMEGVGVIYVPMPSAPSTQLAQALADSVNNAWNPVIATWMGGKDVKEGRQIFVENSIPAYGTPAVEIFNSAGSGWYDRSCIETERTSKQDSIPTFVVKKTTHSRTKALQNNCRFCDRQGLIFVLS